MDADACFTWSMKRDNCETVSNMLVPNFVRHYPRTAPPFNIVPASLSPFNIVLSLRSRAPNGRRRRFSSTIASSTPGVDDAIVDETASIAWPLPGRVGMVGVGQLGAAVTSNLVRAGLKPILYDVRPHSACGQEVQDWVNTDCE